MSSKLRRNSMYRDCPEAIIDMKKAKLYKWKLEIHKSPLSILQIEKKEGS